MKQSEDGKEDLVASIQRELNALTEESKAMLRGEGGGTENVAKTVESKSMLRGEGFGAENGAKTVERNRLVDFKNEEHKEKERQLVVADDAALNEALKRRQVGGTAAKEDAESEDNEPF